MNILLLTLPILALALTMIPVIPLFSSGHKKNLVKTRFAIHFGLFFLTLIVMTIIFLLKGLTTQAMQLAPGMLAKDTQGLSEGLKFIGAAISTGLACIGAGIAVGGAAPAAIGAYSEDKDTFGKAMIFVVLGEGIAIYGFVISFLILFSK
jgi:V/A-type H+-transporting ATPase subunit K